MPCRKLLLCSYPQCCLSPKYSLHRKPHRLDHFPPGKLWIWKSAGSSGCAFAAQARSAVAPRNNTDASPRMYRFAVFNGCIPFVYSSLGVPACFRYGGKFTVTVLEHVCVPASQTLYMKLAWPVVPVESSYEPSFGVVAITTPSR
jgi:hypothetical protein